MKKIVLVADTHFQARERLGILRVTRDSRLEDKLASWAICIKWAMTNGAEAIFHLGDLFHQQNPGDKVRAEVAHVLAPFVKAGGLVYLIKGNHDGPGMLSPWHSESMLADGLQVISEPKVVWVAKRGIVCIPETPEAQTESALAQLTESLKKMTEWGRDDDGGPLAVLGHGPIRGLRYGTQTLMYPKEGISPDWLQSLGAPYALFGDIHLRQLKRRGDFHYGYVGSLNRQNFGERDYVPGFMVLGFNKTQSKLKFIPVQDRAFVQYEFSEGQSLAVDAPLEAIGGRKPVIKVVLTGSANWMHSSKVQNVIRKLSRCAMKLIEEPHLLGDHVSESSRSKGGDFSVTAAFRRFVKKEKVPKSLAKVGLGLLEQAQVGGD